MGLAFHSGLEGSEPMTITYSRAKRVLEKLGLPYAGEGVLDAKEILAAFAARIEPLILDPRSFPPGELTWMLGPDGNDLDFAEGLETLAKESPTGEVSYS